MAPKFSSEQEKYIWLNENTNYGSSFHAKGVLDHILSLQMHSVCDVGTGRGTFCRWAAANGCEIVYGVDFAIDPRPPSEEIKYIKAFSHDIPLPDGAIEYVTSFDMLEHVLEEDVVPTLEEFSRLATKGWIFSIAYWQSVGYQENVGDLHPTVKGKDWWYDKISKYGEVNFHDKYWLVTL